MEIVDGDFTAAEGTDEPRLAEVDGVLRARPVVIGGQPSLSPSAARLAETIYGNILTLAIPGIAVVDTRQSSALLLTIGFGIRIRHMGL